MDEAREAIARAVEHLAGTLGCDPAEIGVQEVLRATWRDSSLGCPQPGMMYLQVLTPGYRIRLQHAGADYLLHTDRGSRAILCPEALRADPYAGPGDGAGDDLI